MSGGRGQGRQLKRTRIVSFSKIKEDPSGPQLSKVGAREAMREAERVGKVTPKMMLNEWSTDAPLP